MTVAHAIYVLALSVVYFVVAILDRDLAAALTILFVVLVIIPAPVTSWHSRREDRQA